MSDYYTIEETSRKKGALIFSLTGSWTVSSLEEIIRYLPFKKLQQTKTKHIVFNAKNLKEFDTSAAWYFNDVVKRLRGAGIKVDIKSFQKEHCRIWERVANLPFEEKEEAQKRNRFVVLCNKIGCRLFDWWDETKQIIGFLGHLIVNIINLFNPRYSVRLRSIVFQLYEIGIKATPIIFLMAFSIALVTGYQGAVQLEQFGATIFAVDLVVISTLREMGVLLTAIMLAGRSGSAFAAQIGTMKLNEEVDALKTMGVSPFEVLVFPRLVAIVIALPLLTFIADIAGILGAYTFSITVMDLSDQQFLTRLYEATEDPNDFWVGFIKAPFFALLIGLVGCLQGLQVKGSAEEVGRRTTVAVVQSIFLVIIADGIFSIIFTELGL